MSDNNQEIGGIAAERTPDNFTRRSEFLLVLILIGLVAVDIGLVYLLSSILQGRMAQAPYEIIEMVIYIGILLAIIIISFILIRTVIKRYKVPAATIPESDRDLLEDLIRNEKKDAVDIYVRLASLSGPTGTATKLGLTGLPLATIGLTIFFSATSFFMAEFLDLAKLTLGAFIGSFVQRSGEALERAVRETSPPGVQQLPGGQSPPAPQP